MEEIRDKRGLTEAEAIERYRSRNYPKPALTSDAVIFWKDGEDYKVLLVWRGGHPFIHKWALPGGFANENEPVEITASRELEEETGVKGVEMKLVDVFSKPGRDPRGWVVSAAFYTVLESAPAVNAGDDAADAGWFTLSRVDGKLSLRKGETVVTSKDLAFDHEDVIEKALRVAGIEL